MSGAFLASAFQNDAFLVDAGEQALDPGGGGSKRNEYASVRQRTQQEQAEAVLRELGVVAPIRPGTAPKGPAHDDDEEELILWLMAA